MPPVKFKLTTANEKALFDALHKSEKKIDAVQKKLDKTGKKGKKSFNGMKLSAKDFTTGLLGVGTAAAAVTVAIGAIKTAFENAQKAQEGFYNKNVTLSEAKAKALWNMPATFEGGKEGLESMATGIQEKTGAKLPEIYNILSSGFSAGGSGETLTNAAEMAATLQKAGVGEGSELVGSGLDLASVTGKKDAAANFGWLKQIGGASRLVSLKQQQQLLPGLVAGTQMGDSAEQSAELIATITQMIKDTEGRMSATGSIGFSDALKSKELVPKIVEKVNKKTGKKERKTEWSRLEGGTTMERLSNMQKVYQGADEETKLAIMEKMGGEKKMKGFVQGALSNSPLYQKTLSESQAKITAPGATSAKQIEEYKAMLASGSEGMVASGKTGDAALDALQTVGKDKAASMGKIRSLVREYMGGSDSTMTQLLGMAEKSGGGALMSVAGGQKGEAGAGMLKSFLDAIMPGVGTTLAATSKSGGKTESDMYLSLLEKVVTKEDKNTQAYKDLTKAIKALSGIANGTPSPNSQEVD